MGLPKRRWYAKIGGGFAGQNAPFASHPNDNERAWKLLVYLRSRSIPWEKVKPAFENYLGRAQGWGPSPQEQMHKVESLFRPWLDDVYRKKSQ